MWLLHGNWRWQSWQCSFDPKFGNWFINWPSKLRGKVFSKMWGSFPLWGMVVSAVVCFPGTALKSFVLLLMLISQGKKKSLQYCVKELWGSPAVEFSEDLQYLHSPGCAGLGASRCDSHKPLIRLGFCKVYDRKSCPGAVGVGSLSSSTSKP